MIPSITEKKDNNSSDNNIKTEDTNSRKSIKRINCDVIADLISEGGYDFVKYLGMQDLLHQHEIGRIHLLDSEQGFAGHEC